MNAAFTERDYENLDASQNSIFPGERNEEEDEKVDEEEEYVETAEVTPEVTPAIEDSSFSTSRAQAGTELNSAIQRLTITPSSKTHKSQYSKKVQSNFFKIVKKPTSMALLSEESCREVGVQTSGMAFGPVVDSKYLLGEVRPWGGKAKTLLRGTK